MATAGCAANEGSSVRSPPWGSPPRLRFSDSTPSSASPTATGTPQKATRSRLSAHWAAMMRSSVAMSSTKSGSR